MTPSIDRSLPRRLGMTGTGHPTQSPTPTTPPNEYIMRNNSSLEPHPILPPANSPAPPRSLQYALYPQPNQRRGPRPSLRPIHGRVPNSPSTIPRFLGHGLRSGAYPQQGMGRYQGPDTIPTYQSRLGSRLRVGALSRQGLGGLQERTTAPQAPRRQAVATLQVKEIKGRAGRLLQPHPIPPPLLRRPLEDPRLGLQDRSHPAPSPPHHSGAPLL